MGSGGRWRCTTNVPASPATTLSLSRGVLYTQPGCPRQSRKSLLQKVRNIFYSSNSIQLIYLS